MQENVVAVSEDTFQNVESRMVDGDKEEGGHKICSQLNGYGKFDNGEEVNDNRKQKQR